jgi:Alginate export
MSTRISRIAGAAFIALACLTGIANAQAPGPNEEGGPGPAASATAENAAGGTASSADADDPPSVAVPVTNPSNSPDSSPQNNGATAGAAAVDTIGRPPTPVSTVELPYPRLAGIWSGVPLQPSLSERFNEKLPYWLRFSGEMRERFEGYSGGGYKSINTNDYDLQRIRLGMQIQPLSWLTFFIQTQDARVFGITPALPPYENTFDIREAFVQFGRTEGSGFALQTGRFDMSYGNNRFIGDSWWTNVSRSFDGVRAIYQQGRFRVDAFATSVVIIRNGVIDHHLEGNNLYGVYATAHDVIPHATLDVYEFWNLRPNFGLVGLKNGNLDEWTTGFRWVGALPYNLDYRTEMAIQRGTLSPDKIRAWTGHWDFGYTFKDLRIRPRFFVEYDYASGSNNTKSGIDGTFDPIYPSTHDKLGLADQVGWRNIQDLRFGQDWHLARKWSLGTSFHDFWLANAHDGLYPTRGSIVALDLAGTDGTHVGEEYDIQLIYTPTRQTQIDAGYGHITPGQFLKNAIKGAVAYNYPYMSIEYVF